MRAARIEPLYDSVIKSVLPIRAAVGHVRHARRLARQLHAAERLTDGTEEPDDARPRMGPRQVARFVHREPVGSVDARQLREDATFATPPPSFSGQCHMQFARVMATKSTASFGSSTMPLGLGPVRDQAFEPSVTCVAIDAPRRIVHAGLTLVGEIQIAVPGEREIVDAFEALREGVCENRLDAAAAGFSAP